MGKEEDMLRNILIIIFLLVLSGAAWFASGIYPDPLIDKVYFELLSITAAYIIYTIIAEKIAVKGIRDPKTRYSVKKAISLLLFAAILLISIRIWVEDTQSLLVSYGIIVAGLAIALQDLFRSFVGGILIIATGIYRTGDRIEITGIYGDVMDIGMTFTTLMEIRGWVDGDQPSGRISLIPNGLVIGNAVNNYTKDHSFIWDEIAIPISYDSNWRRAHEKILSMAREETAVSTKDAETEIERIGEKYYLPKKVTEPSVFLSFNDNWINCDLRYVTDVRNRRVIRDAMCRRILRIVEEDDEIRIANSSMEISGSQDIHILSS